MHENREISSTPWSDDQGRSAKAINRTADMYVLEKSDCAVVPVNQEGRARAVENIVQSHMLPTQSGSCMFQGMGGVRQAVLPRWIHVRPVCVDALARICAGAISEDRPYRDHYSSEAIRISNGI
jgi:hypothetical protein